MKLRRMAWVEHAKILGKSRNTYRILSKTLQVRDYLEELGVDGSII